MSSSSSSSSSDEHKSSSVSSSANAQGQSEVQHPFDPVREALLRVALGLVAAEWPVAAEMVGKQGGEDKVVAGLVKRLETPAKPGMGEIALPCFHFMRLLKGQVKNPAQVSSAVAKRLEEDASLLEKQLPQVESIKQAGPYLNVTLKPAFMARVLTGLNDGSLTAPLPNEGRDKVMIEYSQPNTHKAFHVGHMRNAALGDCLVRLYRGVGHEVVAVNYFGDEGAHIAKCLWYLRKYWLPSHSLDEIAEEARGEFLGDMYSKAVAELDLGTLTAYPFPDFVAAKVVSIEHHPNPAAPKNWHKVVVEVDAEGTQREVVCGGEGYKVGDIVAYAPVGLKFNKKLIEPKDMQGVTSHGIMLAYREVGVKEPELSEEEQKELETKRQEIAAAQAAADKEAEEKEAQQQEAAGDAGKGGKKKNKKKNKKKGRKKKVQSNRIMKLPAGTKPGTSLAEVGKFDSVELADGETVVGVWKQRNEEARATLRAMEAEEPEITALWEKTKKWSLDEFKRIYAWLSANFDHDFFESEVADESAEMVREYHKKGVLIESNGAIGADLSKFKLGFSVLLKSDGTGLYATKDLALARRKFDQFKIDKSIYIVDAAQTLHFQQVFKVLELMGYEKAKKCFHLPYGMVVLPDGKMSSRKGTVKLFSELKNGLYESIYKDYLSKYDPSNPEAKAEDHWTTEQLEDAKRKIALATIKYGMLKVGTDMDIVFDQDQWVAKKGDTGPYLMYAYARIRKMVNEFQPTCTGTVKPELLTQDSERRTLAHLNGMWNTIADAAYKYDPSLVCRYLFELAQLFSAWYQNKANSVKDAEPDLQATRLAFIGAIASALKLGLGFLGIETLERM